MSSKAFFKENFVLVAGITLPLALALVFFFATQISMIHIDPPKTKVVFATNYQTYTGYPYGIKVEDDGVFLHFNTKKNEDYTSWQEPELYLFDPVSGKSEKLAMPEIDKKKDGKYRITSLDSYKLDTTNESPDGYVFESDYHGGGNIMTEIFGGGSYSRYQFVLRKDGHRVRVPNAVSWNSTFIGWVKE